MNGENVSTESIRQEKIEELANLSGDMVAMIQAHDDFFPDVYSGWKIDGHTAEIKTEKNIFTVDDENRYVFWDSFIDGEWVSMCPDCGNPLGGENCN